MCRFFMAGFSFMATAGLALAGCSNGSTALPSASTTVIAGEYLGTTTDPVGGAQPVATTLAQHGSAVGGTLMLGSGAASNPESIALTISGSTLSGSGTATFNGAVCTFTINATYANNQISGTYVPVGGCAGRSGTISLTQQCANPAASAARRAQGAVPSC